MCAGTTLEALEKFNPLMDSIQSTSRLWIAALHLPTPVVEYLDDHGFPIRYGYVKRSWPVSMYQTVFATEPGSAEMPSAARPFTPELVTRLVANGVQFAPLVLHTGVASQEKHEPPYEEYYRVPRHTADRVNSTRRAGHRVIAVGTTVVRALETVTDERGDTHPGEGWTQLVVTPDRLPAVFSRALAECRAATLRHLALPPDERVDVEYVTDSPWTAFTRYVGDHRSRITVNASVALTVDEELFAPLTGHMSDVVDGRVVLWISGGNFEDNKRPCRFSADQARVDLSVMMLRAKDRLSEDFADAPLDAALSRGERAAWDTYAAGRAGRLGIDVRRPRQLYDFRLQHGFTNVADAAFERCWQAESVTWQGIREICKETGAADRAPSKVPVDLLRQK